MNEHEIQRIAAAMNQLRPDWPIQQLKTLLTTKLADRPRRDVAVALAWVACEPSTSTPYRVLEAGPWWKAAGVETSGGSAIKRGPICVHCGFERHECEKRWQTDHTYEGPDDWMRRRLDQKTDTHATVGALRELVSDARTVDADTTSAADREQAHETTGADA